MGLHVKLYLQEMLLLDMWVWWFEYLTLSACWCNVPVVFSLSLSLSLSLSFSLSRFLSLSFSLFLSLSLSLSLSPTPTHLALIFLRLQNSPHQWWKSNEAWKGLYVVGDWIGTIFHSSLYLALRLYMLSISIIIFFCTFLLSFWIVGDSSALSYCACCPV